MSEHCTRCAGTGFDNIEQLPDSIDPYDTEAVLQWLETHKGEEHDVGLCICCSNGEEWYNEPGRHDRRNPLDPFGCR